MSQSSECRVPDDDLDPDYIAGEVRPSPGGEQWAVYDGSAEEMTFFSTIEEAEAFARQAFAAAEARAESEGWDDFASQCGVLTRVILRPRLVEDGYYAGPRAYGMDGYSVYDLRAPSDDIDVNGGGGSFPGTGPTSPDPSCATCRFSHATEVVNCGTDVTRLAYECRRYALRPVARPPALDALRWPGVGSDSWCGEFEPKT